MAAPPDHQLLFFYTLRPDGDEKARMVQKEAIHCAQGVEKDMGSELIRLNLHQNPRNEKIFHAFSHRSQICTGTPYFFNKTNGEYVCGYSTCDEIRKWAGLPPSVTQQ